MSGKIYSVQDVSDLYDKAASLGLRLHVLERPMFGYFLTGEDFCQYFQYIIDVDNYVDYFAANS